MKNCIRWLLYAWLVIEVAGCSKNNRGVNVSILAVFTGDTISCRTLAYKIRITNNNNRDVSFYFKKRQRGMIDLPDESSIENAGLFLFDSTRQKKCKLLLPPYFPEEIIVKGNKKIDLMFFSYCQDFISAPQYIKNDTQYAEKITNLIRGNNLYWYQYHNYPVVEDSIPVVADSTFKIEFRNSFISDMQ